MITSIILKLEDNKLYLSPLKFVMVENTGIGPITRFPQTYYVALNNVSVKKDTQELFGEIGCCPDEDNLRQAYCHLFESQEGKIKSLGNIQKITFKDVPTNFLLGIKYQKFNLINKREQNEKVYREDNPKSIPAIPINKPVIEKEEKVMKEKPVTSEPKIEYPISFEEVVIVSFDSIIFKNNSVIFEVFIKSIAKQIQLKIENSYCREEFNTIKKYFTNYLEIKEIRAKVTGVKTGYHTYQILSVSSNEIEKINAELIEEVRFNFAYDKVRKTKQQTDSSKKILQTVDEFLDELSKSDKSIEQETEKFLQYLIEKGECLHSLQLGFLSKKHFAKMMKLRFSTKPTFAFLFLIQGKSYLYFVYETVSAKLATYIWRAKITNPSEKELKNSLKEEYKKIENHIDFINENNRNEYRKNKHDNFMFIEHDYESENGYDKWVGELNRFLNYKIE